MSTPANSVKAKNIVKRRNTQVEPITVQIEPQLLDLLQNTHGLVQKIHDLVQSGGSKRCGETSSIVVEDLIENPFQSVAELDNFENALKYGKSELVSLIDILIFNYICQGGVVGLFFATELMNALRQTFSKRRVAFTDICFEKTSRNHTVPYCQKNDVCSSH